MEINYKKEQIEEVLNILNALPFQGFDIALKMARIYHLLNTPFDNTKNPTKDES